MLMCRTRKILVERSNQLCHPLRLWRSCL